MGLVARSGDRCTRGLILTLCLLGVAPAAAQPEMPQLTEEQFIESLGDRYSAHPVDRQRLARMFFGVASTLEGGQNTLLFLQSRVAPRNPSLRAEGSALDLQYKSYTEIVERFRAGASRLMDRPESPLHLFRVLMDGADACWQLDGYTRALETWGVNATDLVAVLTSVEACARFRELAFQPRVEASILELLADGDYRKDQIQELREKIAELERGGEDPAKGDGE